MAKRRPKREAPAAPPQTRSKKAVIATVAGLALLAAGLWFLLPPKRDISGQNATSEHAASNPAGDPNYVESATCAGCHAEIAATYAETGMGRSFYPATRAAMADQVGSGVEFFHEASGQHFAIAEREGRYFQRRWMTAADGSEAHSLEREIHFVMGSGNHARTYLHRHPNGKIVELPLGWYAEKGGFFGMNPGFDQAKHGGFRREIGFDCMGCHNGYPSIEPGADLPGRDALFAGALPQGIDCQRCHGPGRAHVEAVARGARAEEIRAAMFNPAHADPARQLEVCLQCHLESTSRRLPYTVRSFDRGAFSFRPGEPLADFVSHFDHPKGVRDDKFEIAHHGYQLLRSACFRGSSGMTCTTCHDPHEVFRGDEARTRFAKACASCHESSIAKQSETGGHPAGDDCVGCHMPKRRTDDVVHVVMTDHSIPRRPPPSDRLLAAKREIVESDEERYRGEVVPLYPPEERSALIRAVAQVVDGSNIETGKRTLRGLLEKDKPPHAAPYHYLAEAYWQQGRAADALQWYREAVARDAGHSAARRNYALSLAQTGAVDEAERELRTALGFAPDDAKALTNLADVLTAKGLPAEAEAAAERALRADPDAVEAMHNLARARAAQGETAGALEAARRAVDIEPAFAAAHNTLGKLLLDSDRLAEAETAFRNAIAADPAYAEARYNLAGALAQSQRFAEAESELRAAIRASPDLAMAHNNLGSLLAMRGDRAGAERSFRAALGADPRLAEAHFNLGVAQASAGRVAEARKSFESAIEVQPDYPEARMNLAVTLASLGEREAAKAQLAIVQKSDDESLRQAAQGLLNELE